MYNIPESHHITMIKSALYIFEQRNYKSEQIAKCISKLDVMLRERIYDIAIFYGKKTLANEIKKANKLIGQIQVEEFKQAVSKGIHEEFLSNMPSEDKKVLRNSLHKVLKYPLNQQLTEQEQKYLNILNQSIRKDEETEAKREGFSSIEEWEKFKKRNERWNPTTKIIPKISSPGTRFRDERIKILSTKRPTKKMQTQTVDINGSQVKLNEREMKIMSKPKHKPSSRLDHIYIKDTKSYIDSIIKNLSTNMTQFSQWRLEYIKFKALLSTKMISLTDIKRLALALAYAKVKYNYEEQELEFRNEQSNLLSLISLLNNKEEMNNQGINYLNLDQAYQEIIESNLYFQEQRKR